MVRLHNCGRDSCSRHYGGIGWLQCRSFDGNSVKNQDNFFLRFTRMSKTDAHIITAEAGAVISVELEIEKGKVDIVIGAEGDEPIYFGNDVDSGKFELPVSAAGQYKVTVEARGAAGEIAVQRLPNAAEE